MMLKTPDPDNKLLITAQLQLAIFDLIYVDLKNAETHLDVIANTALKAQEIINFDDSKHIFRFLFIKFIIKLKLFETSLNNNDDISSLSSELDNLYQILAALYEKLPESSDCSLAENDLSQIIEIVKSKYKSLPSQQNYQWILGLYLKLKEQRFTNNINRVIETVKAMIENKENGVREYILNSMTQLGIFLANPEIISGNFNSVTNIERVLELAFLLLKNSELVNIWATEHDIAPQDTIVLFCFIKALLEKKCFLLNQYIQNHPNKNNSHLILQLAETHYSLNFYCDDTQAKKNHLLQALNFLDLYKINLAPEQTQSFVDIHCKIKMILQSIEPKIIHKQISRLYKHARIEFENNNFAKAAEAFLDVRHFIDENLNQLILSFDEWMMYHNSILFAADNYILDQQYEQAIGLYEETLFYRIHDEKQIATKLLSAITEFIEHADSDQKQIYENRIKQLRKFLNLTDAEPQQAMEIDEGIVILDGDADSQDENSRVKKLKIADPAETSDTLVIHTILSTQQIATLQAFLTIITNFISGEQWNFVKTQTEQAYSIINNNHIDIKNQSVDNQLVIAKLLILYFHFKIDTPRISISTLKEIHEIFQYLVKQAPIHQENIIARKLNHDEITQLLNSNNISEVNNTISSMHAFVQTKYTEKFNTAYTEHTKNIRSRLAYQNFSEASNELVKAFDLFQFNLNSLISVSALTTVINNSTNANKLIELLYLAIIAIANSNDFSTESITKILTFFKIIKQYSNEQYVDLDTIIKNYFDNLMNDLENKTDDELNNIYDHMILMHSNFNDDTFILISAKFIEYYADRQFDPFVSSLESDEDQDIKLLEQKLQSIAKKYNQAKTLYHTHSEDFSNSVDELTESTYLLKEAFANYLARIILRGNPQAQACRETAIGDLRQCAAYFETKVDRTIYAISLCQIYSNITLLQTDPSSAHAYAETTIELCTTTLMQELSDDDEKNVTNILERMRLIQNPSNQAHEQIKTLISQANATSHINLQDSLNSYFLALQMIQAEEYHAGFSSQFIFELLVKVASLYSKINNHMESLKNYSDALKYATNYDDYRSCLERICACHQELTNSALDVHERFLHLSLSEFIRTYFNPKKDFSEEMESSGDSNDHALLPVVFNEDEYKRPLKSSLGHEDSPRRAQLKRNNTRVSFPTNDHDISITYPIPKVGLGIRTPPREEMMKYNVLKKNNDNARVIQIQPHIQLAYDMSNALAEIRNKAFQQFETYIQTKDPLAKQTFDFLILQEDYFFVSWTSEMLYILQQSIYEGKLQSSDAATHKLRIQLLGISKGNKYCLDHVANKNFEFKDFSQIYYYFQHFSNKDSLPKDNAAINILLLLDQIRSFIIGSEGQCELKPSENLRTQPIQPNDLFSLNADEIIHFINFLTNLSDKTLLTDYASFLPLMIAYYHCRARHERTPKNKTKHEHLFTRMSMLLLIHSDSDYAKYCLIQHYLSADYYNLALAKHFAELIRNKSFFRQTHICDLLQTRIDLCNEIQFSTQANSYFVDFFLGLFAENLNIDHSIKINIENVVNPLLRTNVIPQNEFYGIIASSPQNALYQVPLNILTRAMQYYINHPFEFNLDNYSKFLRINKHEISFILSKVDFILTFDPDSDHRKQKAIAIIAHELRSPHRRNYDSLQNKLNELQRSLEPSQSNTSNSREHHTHFGKRQRDENPDKINSHSSPAPREQDRKRDQRSISDYDGTPFNIKPHSPSKSYGRFHKTPRNDHDRNHSGTGGSYDNERERSSKHPQ